MLYENAAGAANGAAGIGAPIATVDTGAATARGAGAATATGAGTGAGRGAGAATATGAGAATATGAIGIVSSIGCNKLGKLLFFR